MRSEPPVAPITPDKWRADGRADDSYLRFIIFSSASSVPHSADIIVLVPQKKIVRKQQKIVLRCKII